MKTKFTIFGLISLIVLVAVSTLSVSANPRVVNEAFALRNVRTLYWVQMAYSANIGNDEFADLATLGENDLIDGALASGYKHFYNYTIITQPSTTSSRSNFVVSAVPARDGKTGKMSFFVNLFGEIRGADRNGEPATASDPIVGDCSTGKVADNDRCALYNVLRLRTAERFYFAANGRFGVFSELHAAGYIDSRLRLGFDRGFLYTVTTTSPIPGFPALIRLTSIPYQYGQTGTKSYFFDQSFVIRGGDKNGSYANETDPPIGVY